jgi:Flp pilus assembly secretin CpaC
MRSPYPFIPLAFALVFAGVARASTLTVPLDHAERLSIRGTAANVVVGNPHVADVTVVDSHTVYVLGRSYGSTGVNITDALGRTVFSGDVTVARPAAMVSVYRGVARSDLTCAGGCSEMHNAAPAAGGDGSGDSSGGDSGGAAATPSK